MGYYSGSSGSSPGEEKQGCRDVLLLTRAAFGVLLVPLGILAGVLLAIVLIVTLFSHSLLLGFVGLGVLGVGIFCYARWEQRHFHGL